MIKFYFFENRIQKTFIVRFLRQAIVTFLKARNLYHPFDRCLGKRRSGSPLTALTQSERIVELLDSQVKPSIES